MTAFEIKIIAIITMVIDHIGLFFFPDILMFRVIGRLSFPLFAWLIANGAYHTHNINSYLKRIFIFALLSQVPFILANQTINPSYWKLNVLFTLFLGLLAIYFIKKTENKRLWISTVVLCAFAAFILKTDYDVEGVLSVVAFYLFAKNVRYLILSQIIIFLVPPILLFASEFRSQMVADIFPYIEPFGLFALTFILSYNGKEGLKAKYLFYIFYPLQYVLIYFLKIFF